MEFGKIQNVDHVNWDLPSDDLISTQFLATLNKNLPFQIYIGTPAWGHKEWIGQLYPAKTKSSDFLNFYSRQYDCIELNTTHYQIPTKEKAELWMSKVPANFRFCPKLYQGISHSPTGLTDAALLKEWFQFLDRLQPNLGPCFIQFPPNFSYANKGLLFSFLQIWPLDYELTLEFRHPSWFQDGKIIPALTQYLQKRKIGLVMTDVAGRRDVLHSSISSDFLILRFIGNELHASDYTRAKNWVHRFGHWRDQGLRRIYLMVHEPDDILAPQMTTTFVEYLRSGLQYTHHFKTLTRACEPQSLELF